MMSHLPVQYLLVTLFRTRNSWCLLFLTTGFRGRGGGFRGGFRGRGRGNYSKRYNWYSKQWMLERYRHIVCKDTWWTKVKQLKTQWTVECKPRKQKEWQSIFNLTYSSFWTLSSASLKFTLTLYVYSESSFNLRLREDDSLTSFRKRRWTFTQVKIHKQFSSEWKACLTIDFCWFYSLSKHTDVCYDCLISIYFSKIRVKCSLPVVRSLFEWQTNRDRTQTIVRSQETWCLL